MIIIERDSINKIDLTLTELVTLANPYYLFVFTNKQTNEVSKCLLTDISVYPERYNRFQLLEPANVELICGDYLYEVYEKSVNNTDIPSSTYLLETGIAKVPTTLLTESVFESTLSTTPKVYEATN